MKYYVYHLIDPRDGTVFYVGKGSKQRIRCHESQARRAKGNTSAKVKRIKEIWAADLPVSRVVVRLFETEAEAFAFEAQQIKDLPNLTNQVGVERAEPICSALLHIVAFIIRATDGLRRPFVTGYRGASLLAKDVVAVSNQMDGAGFARATVDKWVKRFGHEEVNRRLGRYGIQVPR